MRLHLRILTLIAAIILAHSLAHATLYDVTMTANSYSPDYLNLQVGDSVRWNNQSGEDRFMTTMSGEFTSGRMAPNTSYTRRMTAGSFNITDILNQSIHQMIDVGTSTDPAWTEFAIPMFNLPQQDVFFTDSLHGWLANYMGVHRTTNGGQSWSLSEFSDEGSRALYFLNNSLGYSTGRDGFTYRTNDGGATWNYLYTPGEGLTDIVFTNSLHGWACGEDGMHPRTSNGGTNWQAAPQVHGIYETGIDFIDNQTGWMCGNRGRIWHSTDGGATWNVQTEQNDFNIIFNSMDMWDAQTGVAVGTDGMVYRTSNGGANWISSTSGTSREIFKVVMTSATNAWMCGDSGLVARSFDGGATWTQLATPCFFRFNCVYFTDPANGYFCTGNGRVFHYADSVEAPPPWHNPAEVARPADGNWFPIQDPNNYPNPFNPTTNIEFDLSTASTVKLEVFDMLGRSVAVLANGAFPSGRHTATFDANNMSSGMYFYQLTSGPQTITRKMILQK